ncbi:ABC transporter permease [Bacillus sp. FJAT-45066]|uniref:ABC transporter permease n=1 Tax=Bacillus sp. FJAT-45066 TaxID=2011010 RepID=UPI000BB77712|nr:ABC transporter permease subunit [Bacillus sp. FJAT-45066]
MNRNWPLWIGSFLFILLLIVTFIGPYLPMIDKELTANRVVITEEGFDTAPHKPSLERPFGSDRDGRDMLSIVVMGAKETLVLIFTITVVRYLIATVLALLAANRRGPANIILQGWNNIFAALPVIFSAIILLNMPILVFNDQRTLWAVLIIALIEVGRVGTVLQHHFHSISKTPYVEAGITVGISPITLFTSYYIPNALPEMAVQFFLDLGRTTLLIGQLGIFSIFLSQEFLQLTWGAGEIVNTSGNWATLLGQARGDIIRKIFWIPFFPALAIAFTVLTFNVLGEGLRKHFHRLQA